MSEAIELPPIKLAMIDDNSTVIDVLHTDERLAAILLSNPIVKDVTDLNVVETVLGWMYDYNSGLLSPRTHSDEPGIAEV